MTQTRAAFLHSKKLEAYAYPPQCPFNISRAGRLHDMVDGMGLLDGDNVQVVGAKEAPRMVLKKFHEAKYLHALKNAANGPWDLEAFHMGLGTPDCPIFKGMYEYAALAAGHTLKGAELILADKVDLAFNPSGGYHHAMPARCAGFCYINDVALACMVLSEAGKRVLYLDVDVHNGDGVSAAFYERSDVMTISLHQNPRTLFPGTGFEDEIGKGEGKGYCVNVPLPVGTYDEAYMMAFNHIVPPLLRKFDPDVIVFELGVDALSGDPLAHLYLTNNTYVEIIDFLQNTGKPILAVGGGGYHIENAVRAWALAWSCFVKSDRDNYGSIGLGGVMLESTEWEEGLIDKRVVVNNQQKQGVLGALEKTIDKIKSTIFPIHGF